MTDQPKTPDLSAAVREAFAQPAAPPDVQVEATIDQEIKAAFLACQEKLRALGAPAIILCCVMEKEAGNPATQYLAHTMSGDLMTLHRASSILLTHLGQTVTKQAQGKSSGLIVPEGAARAESAKRGGGPAIIVPGGK